MAAPRGCADSGSTPPAAEPLQGPLLIHLLSRPGPPGECPLETGQPSKGQPAARPASVTKHRFLSENSGHPDPTAPGRVNSPVGHPSVLSPQGQFLVP